MQLGIGIIPPCIDLEDIKKLLKSIKFYEIESLVLEKLSSLKKELNIAEIRSKILENYDDEGDILLIEIVPEETDIKKRIEIWKNVSNTIRSEIDRKYGSNSEDIQRKIWITLASDSYV